MKRLIPTDFSTVSLYSVAAKVFQLAITIWLVRALSVEDYAGYTIFFTFASTVFGVAGNSIAIAYVRYSTEKLSDLRRDYRDWLLGFSHLLNTAWFICLLLAARPLAGAFEVASGLICVAVVYGYLLGAFQLNLAFLQSRERYGKSGRLENFKQVVLLAAVSLAIVGFSGTLGSVLMSYCVAGLLSLLFSVFVLRNAIVGGELSLRGGRDKVRDFVSVSVWIVLYSATTQLFNQVNVTMLSLYETRLDVAEYGVASRYYTMILLLLPSIKTVLRVRMSKSEMVRSTANQKDFSVRWAKKTFAIFFVGVAVCGLLAEVAFPILNGADYANAIVVFQILCVSAFFAYLLAPSSALIMSLNRYKTQFGLALAALGLNLLGNYWLIPDLGASGAAIATTVSQFVLNLLMTVVVFKVGSKS